MDSNHDKQIQNLLSYRLDDKAVLNMTKMQPCDAKRWSGPWL